MQEPKEVAEARAVASNDVQEALEIFEGCQALQIQNHDDLTFAVEATADVIEQRKALQARRDAILKKQRAVIDDVKALFAPAIDYLEEAEQTLRDSLIQYRHKCDEQRSDLIDQAAKAIEASSHDVADSVIAAAESYEVPNVDGLQWREKSDVVVEDTQAVAGALVDLGYWECLTVNKPAIKAVLKKGAEIPGVRLESTLTTTITPSKVKRA